MCTNPRTAVYPASVYERLRGLISPRTLSFPCGKCSECLKKRQNDLATRVYNEARSKGCACFVTLTYDPKYIPVAQSLWCVDRETGEFALSEKAELVPDVYRKNELGFADVLRGQFADYKYKGAPQVYTEIKSFSELSENDWFVRYTPTLYYEDVQLAMKRFRKKCKKEFTYVAVGEYGASPNSTQRPHYHLVFFGLTWQDCHEFALEWKYGFTNVKSVSFINSDCSDGLAKVSRYVGKYCAKGVFDAYTNKTGCTLKNRLRSSKGLGTNLPLNLVRHLMAFDVHEYDPLDPEKTLTKQQLSEVVDAIIRRSFITINGFDYPLPQSLRRKLFGYQRTDSKSFKRPTAFEGKFLEIFEKAIYNPIYYYVADELRSRSIANGTKEFDEFITNINSTDISRAVLAFEDVQARSRQFRELSNERSILSFYKQHTKI